MLILIVANYFQHSPKLSINNKYNASCEFNIDKENVESYTFLTLI